MVMTLGLKLQLGTVVLPLIFGGALLRAFAQARLARVGPSGAGEQRFDRLPQA